MLEFFKTNATYDISFKTSPQIGDFIFFGTSTGVAQHVAVVTGYNSSTNVVEFVGGNQDNQVTQGSCKWASGTLWGSQYVIGYGRPNYNLSGLTLSINSNYISSSTDFTLQWNQVSGNMNGYNLYIAPVIEGSTSYDWENARIYLPGLDTTSYTVYRGGLKATSYAAYVQAWNITTNEKSEASNFIYFRIYDEIISDLHSPTEGNQYDLNSVGQIHIRGWAVNTGKLNVKCYASIDGGEGKLLTAVTREDVYNSPLYSAFCPDTMVGFEDDVSIENLSMGTHILKITAVSSSVTEVIAELQFTIVNEDEEYVPVANLTYNGNQYALYDNTFLRWTEAEEFCESIGGHLVSIASAEEQKMVTQLLQSGSREAYWIGATDKTSEGTWLWVTGENMSYTNWNTDQPDNWNGTESENYGAVWRTNGCWNDVSEVVQDSNSQGVYGFICEFEGTSEYTITYHLNGGTNSSENPTTYSASVSYLPLQDPAKKYYDFQGWYTAETGGEKFTSSTKCSGNLDLYARWKPTEYTITLDVNGGDELQENTVKATYESSGVSLPVPTKAGYKFLGWYTAKTGGSKVVSIGSTTADRTLYAHWEANTYTVTFDSNGGAAKDAIQVTYGETYGTLPTVTKEGYTFNGWFTKASGGTKVTADTKMQTASDHTLYAQWTAQQYVLLFDANGGTIGGAGSIQTVYDEAYGTLPICTRNGYTFEGWFTMPTGGKEITADTTCQGDATAYAHWTANQYQIILNSNEGAASSEKTKTVTYDQIYGTLEAVQRENYTFGGWFTEKDGGTQITESSKVNTASDHTLYAHWTGVSCVVIYNANGGTVNGNDTASAVYGNVYGELPGCSREGYNFLGWFTTPTGTNKVTESTVCKGDITLYAQWEVTDEGHIHNCVQSILKKATCTEPGIAEYQCDGCSYYYTEEIAATGHITIVLKYKKEVTCTENGYTGDHYCDVCGQMVEAGSVVTAKGHTWDDGTVLKEVTCTENGTKEYHCTVCQETKEEEILAGGHGATVVKFVKQASCTEDGYTGDTYCQTCGQLLEAGTVIPATGTTEPEQSNTEQPATEQPATEQPATEAPETESLKPGTAVTDKNSGGVYKVSSDGKSVEYTKPAAAKATVKIPASIVSNGKTYQVTSIGANAFKNNKNIKKVIISGNITSIGNSAFANCKNLKTVTMGSKVTKIGSKAFYKCTSLTKITIPKSVKSIGKQAFYGCKKLKTITIKTTKLTSKTVGASAFKGTYRKAVIKVSKKLVKKYAKLLKTKGISSKAVYKKF